MITRTRIPKLYRKLHIKTKYNKLHYQDFIIILKLLHYQDSSKMKVVIDWASSWKILISLPCFCYRYTLNRLINEFPSESPTSSAPATLSQFTSRRRPTLPGKVCQVWWKISPLRLLIAKIENAPKIYQMVIIMAKGAREWRWARIIDSRRWLVATSWRWANSWCRTSSTQLDYSAESINRPCFLILKRH